MGISQMSRSGAILIIAVVIIRALTLHKLPKRTFLVLWGVVICRLLLPFSIPWQFSFYTGIDILKQIFRKTASFDTHSEVLFNPIVGAVSGVENAVDIGTTARVVSPVMIIWLLGMCACALFFIVAYFKCRREFRTSLPVTNDFVSCWQREHPMRRTAQIRYCDKIKAPLTYGVFRPVVLLPKKTDWTDETGLRYILTHEFVHIKRFDALTKVLLVSALCVHWFNPFVWVMYVFANRDIELSCDEAVVRTFGESTKSAYALTLINMEEKKSGFLPLCNNFSKNSIEERITSIMKIKKTSVIAILVGLTLIVGVSTAFATSAAEKKETTLGVADDTIDRTQSETLSNNKLLEEESTSENNTVVKKSTPDNGDIIKKTKDYIMHGQDNKSDAEKIKWSETFLNQVNMDAVYQEYLSAGGTEGDIQTFAQYLTLNAPIPDNWKDLVGAELLNIYDEKISYIENLQDDLYQVYVKIDGSDVPYVVVNSRTGYFHG